MSTSKTARYRWLVTCLACLPWLPGVLLPAFSADDSVAAKSGDYLSEIRDWRQRRDDRLASEDGWLTLVGLEWLSEGANRIGNGEASDIRIPGGPEDWGTIILAGSEINFLPATAAWLTIDDAPARPMRLVPDLEGEPTVVRSGDLSFHVIERGSYALRVKNRRAPTLLAFAGVECYPIDARWRKEARFIPAEAGRTIEIANVLGQFEEMVVAGEAEFEHEGHDLSLLGVQEPEATSLWFIFADRTNGRETYGAGRFLYSDGMPVNGRLVLDFNKAYNPPCAFTDFSTCPLPPQQNRLDLAVTAGEKGYQHD